MTIRARLAESSSSRLDALRVSLAAGDRNEPFEPFAALRLGLPRRATAQWWLLEEDDEPVATLLRHSLDLAVQGRRIDGYGLGGVATRPGARRRGHATALCRAAIQAAEAEGRCIGLLFSAIPPGIYERMGFVVAPAFAPACSDLARLAEGPRATLIPLDPRREATTLVRIYEAGHEGLHLHRDEGEWARSLERGGRNLFFGLGDPLEGYLRVELRLPGTVEVLEMIAPPALREPALRAVADLSLRLGRERLEGWFEPPPQIAECFEERGRATTLPMLRGLDEVSTARFWASDYF